MDKIICQLCGQEFKSISNTHLNRAHGGLTLREYINTFGEFRSPQNIINRKQAAERIDYDARTIEQRATRDQNRINHYGELTPRQLQICYGGLLGDFGIHAYSKNRLSGNYLECYHSEEQVPYLKWIQEEFKTFNCRLHEWTRFWKEYNREYTRYWITTCTHPTFTELRKECYGNGYEKHKVVTREWLNKLGPLGLAVWYMDDGHLGYSKNPILNTQGFTFEEHQLIQEYFGEIWNMPVTIQKTGTTDNNGNIQYLTYVPKASKWLFFDLISDFILPEFRYKLGETQ